MKKEKEPQDYNSRASAEEPQDSNADPQPQNVYQANRSAVRVHREEVAENMSCSTSFLSSRNYKLYGITPSDGNCFFWAISSHIQRTGQFFLKPSELRNMVFNYLSDLPKEEKDALQHYMPDKPFHVYLADLSKDGTNADHITAKYTSRMLKMPITVVRDPVDNIIGDHESNTSMLYTLDTFQASVAMCPLRWCKIQIPLLREIQPELCYAVDYTDRFYIGRVLGQGKKPGLFSMKFLHQTSQG
ncbi:hypothetical protein EOD39_20175 [Acipenser ruthenus]|uniref:ubiquitinyl hydrolase 1 n=1 Tax=Acipenser ruthenus TaxID=7906 RepID=A0A444UW91_ACIRT|nr:hypothetical protein EOD39_20175 [Acipenser ruthenus]